MMPQEPAFHAANHRGQTGPTHMGYPLQNEHSSLLVPATFQASAAQTPMINESHDDKLQREIVKILASTANGCIVELGYPHLLKEHHTLNSAYQSLYQEKNALLREIQQQKAALQRMKYLEAVIASQKSAINSKDQEIRLLQNSLAKAINPKAAHIQKQPNSVDVIEIDLSDEPEAENLPEFVQGSSSSTRVANTSTAICSAGGSVVNDTPITNNTSVSKSGKNPTEPGLSLKTTAIASLPLGRKRKEAIEVESEDEFSNEEDSVIGGEETSAVGLPHSEQNFGADDRTGTGTSTTEVSKGSKTQVTKASAPPTARERCTHSKTMTKLPSKAVESSKSTIARKPLRTTAKPKSKPKEMPPTLISEKHDTPMSSELVDECLALLLLTTDRSEAVHFLKPVDPVALNIPTYRQIVAQPMDFETIKNKLENSTGHAETDKQKPRYRTLADFEKDVHLIFSNSAAFNGEPHPVTQAGRIVEAVFKTQMRKLKQKRSLGLTGPSSSRRDIARSASSPTASIASSAGSSAPKRKRNLSNEREDSTRSPMQPCLARESNSLPPPKRTASKTPLSALLEKERASQPPRSESPLTDLSALSPEVMKKGRGLPATQRDGPRSGDECEEDKKVDIVDDEITTSSIIGGAQAAAPLSNEPGGPPSAVPQVGELGLDVSCRLVSITSTIQLPSSEGMDMDMTSEDSEDELPLVVATERRQSQTMQGSQEALQNALPTKTDELDQPANEGDKAAPAKDIADNVAGEELAVRDKTQETASEFEEEEEDEDFSDLTDTEEGKRPVSDTLGEIFYVYDGPDVGWEDHLCCSYCDAEIRRRGSSERKPKPTFDECTSRELVQHVKEKHPVTWKKLRNNEEC